MISFLESFRSTTLALAPSLILGLVIAGLLHVFVKRERIVRHLGKPGFSSTLKASLIGIPLPLCSCGVLPAALSLRHDGASRGASVSFLTSTPQTGVDSFLPTWALLGWPVALAKVAAALIAGVFAGTAVDLADRGAVRSSAPRIEPPRETGSVPYRVLDYAFNVLFRDIYRWIFTGIAVSALITVFLGPGKLAEYPILAGPLGMAAALIVAVPLYVCSVSSVPIAAALVYAGFPVGSALVFLMAGPATNAATMGAVRKKLGKAPFLSYLLSVVAVSIAAGFLLNGIDIPAVSRFQTECHGGPSFIETFAGMLLVGGILWFSVIDLAAFLKRGTPAAGEPAQCACGGGENGAKCNGR